MVQVGDQILDGKVIIISVSNGLVTSIQVTAIKDDFGTPLTITYDPGVAVSFIEATLGPILP